MVIGVVSAFDRIISRYLAAHHPWLFYSWLFLYPAEAFFAWLAAVKGIPAMFAVHLTINGPEAGYPHWIYIGWGIMLAVSALAIGVGLAIRSTACRILGFKLLTIATIQNLATTLILYGLHLLAYTILYCGFAVACAIKVISISYADTVARTILQPSDNHQAGP